VPAPSEPNLTAFVAPPGPSGNLQEQLRALNANFVTGFGNVTTLLSAILTQLQSKPGTGTGGPSAGTKKPKKPSSGKIGGGLGGALSSLAAAMPKDFQSLIARISSALEAPMAIISGAGKLAGFLSGGGEKAVPNGSGSGIAAHVAAALQSAGQYFIPRQQEDRQWTAPGQSQQAQPAQPEAVPADTDQFESTLRSLVQAISETIRQIASAGHWLTQFVMRTGGGEPAMGGERRGSFHVPASGGMGGGARGGFPARPGGFETPGGIGGGGSGEAAAGAGEGIGRLAGGLGGAEGGFVAGGARAGAGLAGAGEAAAGGAAGASGTAAGAGIAALASNPVGWAIAAVAAVVAVTVALVALPKLLEDWGRGIRESQRHLASFSGEIAGIFALAEQREILRGIETGERTAASTQELSDRLEDLSDTNNEMLILWTNIKNVVAAGFLRDIKTLLGDVLNGFAARFNTALAKAFPKFFGEAKGSNVAQWLEGIRDDAEKGHNQGTRPEDYSWPR